jgi:hypothetical protein
VARARAGVPVLAPPATSGDRAVLLWAALGLFLLRVLGQVQAWLLAPAWLPPMEAWYSGLLPYPLLLPAQILLLMIMAVLAHRRTSRGWHRPPRAPARDRALRALALGYFGLMAVRLAWTLHRHGGDFHLHGGIPIAFHWVLALFLLVLARPAAPRR